MWSPARVSPWSSALEYHLWWHPEEGRPTRGRYHLLHQRYFRGYSRGRYLHVKGKHSLEAIAKNTEDTRNVESSAHEDTSRKRLVYGWQVGMWYKTKFLIVNRHQPTRIEQPRKDIDHFIFSLPIQLEVRSHAAHETARFPYRIHRVSIYLLLCIFILISCIMRHLASRIQSVLCL